MSVTRVRLSTAIVALGAVGAAAAAVGGTAATTNAPAARAVGTVTQAAGDLFVKRAATGALAPLRAGARLDLHDIVSAGPGARATVRLLASDTSLPASDDVIEIYKQMAPTEPAAATVGKEFGIAAAAAHRYRTLTLRRSGTSVFITLSP